MSRGDQVFIESNPVFGQLKAEFDACLQDEEARELALAREKFHRDQISRENSALRRGIAKGEAKSKLEVARAMRRKGISDTDIAEITALSPDQIAQL